MSAVEIFYANHNIWEEWLTADNGVLTYTWQNDGWQAVKHGLQGGKETLTREQAIARWPQHEAAIRAALEQSK